MRTEEASRAVVQVMDCLTPLVTLRELSLATQSSKRAAKYEGGSAQVGTREAEGMRELLQTKEPELHYGRARHRSDFRATNFTKPIKVKLPSTMSK